MGPNQVRGGGVRRGGGAEGCRSSWEGFVAPRKVLTLRDRLDSLQIIRVTSTLLWTKSSSHFYRGILHNHALLLVGSSVHTRHPFVWHTPPICIMMLFQKYWAQGSIVKPLDFYPHNFVGKRAICQENPSPGRTNKIRLNAHTHTHTKREFCCDRGSFRGSGAAWGAAPQKMQIDTVWHNSGRHRTTKDLESERSRSQQRSGMDLLPLSDYTKVQQNKCLGSFRAEEEISPNPVHLLNP